MTGTCAIQRPMMPHATHSLSRSEGPLERLTGTLVSAVRWMALIAWGIFWISLSTLLTLLTFRRDLSLTLARDYFGPGVMRLSGARFHVSPLPDIDWNQPYIFVMNHQSMLDIAAAFAAVPVKLRFVAKESLKWVPFIGWYIWMTEMIFIDRSNKRRAMRSLSLAGERIRAGASILMYPEGTRSPDGRILPFKKGPFVLAAAAGVPIIPVAVHGTGSVMPRTGFRLYPGDVSLAMGAPISTAGRDAKGREALIREVRQALIGLHAKMGGPGAVDHDIAAAGSEGG